MVVGATTALGVVSASVEYVRHATAPARSGAAPRQETKTPQDAAVFSAEALQKSGEEGSLRAAAEDPGAASGNAEEKLSEDEQREVERLAQRDREVRQHEQAHIAAGGQYVLGGAQFTYTRGPDGRQYATGGEVSIDTGAESTPEATIEKARVVRRAALAAAQPSAQDRQVAVAASQLEAEARQELAAQRQKEATPGPGAGEEVGVNKAAREAYATSASPTDRIQERLALFA